MADLREVRDHAQQARDRRPLEGVVVAAPASDTSPLRVKLNAYDQRRQHEAYGWAPRGLTDPAPGDAVWVEWADSGKLIVLTWQPS